MPKTIIDTHCHYNLEPLASDWQSHWQAAQAVGVTHSVIVGTSAETSALAITQTQNQPHLKAAVGLHPGEIGEITTPLDQELKTLDTLAVHSSVAAIGETGLDYYRLSAEEKAAQRDQQHQAFIYQIQLAEKTGKPLILHVRDQELPETPTPGNAYWDVLDLLQKHRLHVPFILHCVSGPLQYLQSALELGAYVGVAGNVTYPSAHHIRQLVSLVPPDHLVLETDAPFLPPQGFRGQPCQPAFIRQTAEYLETDFKLDLDQLTQTSRQLFGWE